MKADYMKSTEVQNWNAEMMPLAFPPSEVQNLPILDYAFKLIPPHEYISMLQVCKENFINN